VPEPEARAIVDRWIDRQELTGDFVIPFDDPKLAGATVEDVLAKPEKYLNATLADPFEGPAYGVGKAILYKRLDGSLFIKSYAHGETRYELKATPQPDAAIEIERLARMSMLDYERARKDAARRLGVRADKLDPMVEAKRRETSPAPAVITEQAVMRMFVDRHKDELRYNHTTKDWLIWAGHTWKIDGKNKALSWALDLCRSFETDADTQRVRFASAVELAARAQPEFATESKDWDADPWLIGTPEGVVDLRTGALRSGRPDDMISKVTACAPAPTADCQVWKAFLDSALQNNEPVISFYKRHSGYSLTGSIKEEMILYLVGKDGTGKGTATATIVHTLGDYATVTPITVFTDAGWRQAEYYRADMQGKRYIVSGEPEKGSAWSDAFLSEMTGGDRIPARNPAGKPFKFDPTHKQVMHGNSVPELKKHPVWPPPEAQDPALRLQAAQPRPGTQRETQTRSPADPALDDRRLPRVAEGRPQSPASRRSRRRRIFRTAGRLRPLRRSPMRPRPLPRRRNRASRPQNRLQRLVHQEREQQMSFNTFHDAVKNHPGLEQKTIMGKNWIKGISIKPQVDERNPPQEDVDPVDAWPLR
jgi:hypothetical protein